MTREDAIKVLEQEQSYLMGGMMPNMNDYDDALKMAIAALMEQDVTDINVGNKWISVEDRLPDESMYGKEFIVSIKNRFNESHTATMYWWGENQQAKVWTVWHDVTHWMPLPTPPEVEG